jgi:hypothetical protein
MSSTAKSRSSSRCVVLKGGRVTGSGDELDDEAGCIAVSSIGVAVVCVGGSAGDSGSSVVGGVVVLVVLFFLVVATATVVVDFVFVGVVVDSTGVVNPTVVVGASPSGPRQFSLGLLVPLVIKSSLGIDVHPPGTHFFVGWSHPQSKPASDCSVVASFLPGSTARQTQSSLHATLSQEKPIAVVGRRSSNATPNCDGVAKNTNITLHAAFAQSETTPLSP